MNSARMGVRIAIVGVLLAANVVAADGMKFPEKAIAVMPAIPNQQAVIVYRDGVETLIVESSYETPSETVGWVLPLPAEPTDLAVVDEGMLAALSASLQPNVRHNVRGWKWAPVVVLIIILPLVLIVIFAKSKADRNSSVVGWLCLVVLGSLILVPHLGTKSDSAAQVLELSGETVGNYQVSVLKADSSAGLSEWLSANGLRTLDEQGKAIADDYIRRDWVFAVAKLRREGEGLATPHPIAASFPVDTCVYPMRLTALSQTRLHLNLYVIADEQAQATDLRVLIADKFKPQAAPPDKDGWSFGPNYLALSTGVVLGHPGVYERMWPGCVVTRLAGDLAPEQMDHDIDIQFHPFKAAYRRTLYSAQARNHTVVGVGSLGWGAVLVTLGLICNRRRRPRRLEVLFAAALLLGVLLATGLTYAALPTTPVAVETRRAAFMRHFGFKGVWLRSQMRSVESLVKDGRLHRNMTDEQFAARAALLASPSSAPSSEAINPFTNKEVEMSRSPGNFHIRRKDGEVYFCLYDRDGLEYRFKLPPPAGSASD